MLFSLSSRNVTLEIKSISSDQTTVDLVAQCKTNEDDDDDHATWKDNRIYLCDWIGIWRDKKCFGLGNAGYNDPDTSLYQNSNAKHDTFRLNGPSILIGTINVAPAGASPEWVEASTCLDFFLTNNKGELACGFPQPYLGTSVMGVRLSSSGWLSGLCIGSDGKLHYDEIDLGKHYENDDGIFKKKKDGHFTATARNIGFDSYGHLNCELEDWHHSWHSIDYEIYADVRNGNGYLYIDDPAGFWDTRGPFFRTLAAIPFLGYTAAYLDALRGDESEAVRALAECSYSSVVVGAGMIASVGAGPVGACLAVAAVNFLAISTKYTLDKYIDSPRKFHQATAATIFGVLAEELLVIAGVGIGQIATSYVDLLAEEFIAEGLESLASSAAQWVEKKAIKTLTEKELKFLIQTVLDATLQGKSTDETQRIIDQQIVDWFDEQIAPDLKDKLKPVLENLGYQNGDDFLNKVFEKTVIYDYEDQDRLSKSVSDIITQFADDVPASTVQLIRQTIETLGYKETDDLVQKVKRALVGFVYDGMDELEQRVKTLVQKYGDLIDVDIYKKVKLAITKIGYCYDNPLVTQTCDDLNKQEPLRANEDVVPKVQAYFDKLPSSQKCSLDWEIQQVLIGMGYSTGHSDTSDIRASLADFIYDRYDQLESQIRILARESDNHHQIYPLQKA